MNALLNKLRHYGLKRFIIFTLSEVRLLLVNRFFMGSYSQVQEDLVLDRLTGNKKLGFYVDVGAYDPYRFSNTMRFYRRGWHGINIEPNTEYWKRFVAERSRDINLNIGIANQKGILTFFSMEPPTLSTFVERQAEEYIRNGFLLREKKRISVYPLRLIFDKYLNKKHIDFLSLDVEGFEMVVLKSNDWRRYRPWVLCVETAIEGDQDKTSKIKRSIKRYLEQIGYRFVFDNGLNSFYTDTYHE